MVNEPDCMKCAVLDICLCPKCIGFYTKNGDYISCMQHIIDNGCKYTDSGVISDDNQELHISCMEFIIQNGCYIDFKKGVTYSTTKSGCYRELDWVDKIKHIEKLKMFKEV